MQMRLTALESVQNAAEDLIKQASDTQDDAVKGWHLENFSAFWRLFIVPLQNECFQKNS